MEAVLQQASDDAQKSRSEIDIATGGTGVAVGINGTDFHATPATASGPAFQSAPIQTDIQASLIPENERSVCFFCSRPARVSDLTAVNFVVNGQRRKVLACADDARTIQQGAAPQIQSINENGQQVPWFRSQNYNPYRDYGHTPNAGAGGNFAHPSGGFGSTAGISHGIAHSSAQPPPQPGYYGGGYGYGYSANYNWYSDMIFMNMLMASEPVPYPVYMDSGGMMTGDPAYAMAPPIDNFNNSYDGANGAYDGGYDMPGLNAPDNAAPDNSGWAAFDQMDATLGAYDVNDRRASMPIRTSVRQTQAAVPIGAAGRTRERRLTAAPTREAVSIRVPVSTPALVLTAAAASIPGAGTPAAGAATPDADKGMKMNENCIFCKIASKAIPVDAMFENEEFIAFRDQHPQAPVHVLLIPKAHYGSLLEVTDAGLLGRLMLAAQETAAALNLTEPGFRTVINTGENGGQTVFHLHVHLLGGRFMQWPPG